MTKADHLVAVTREAPSNHSPRNFWQRNRGLAQLTLSLFMMSTGAGMTAVALPLFVAGRYGWGIEAGLALGIRLLPNILLGSIAGELVSRFDPRRVIFVSSLLGATFVASIPATTTLWHIHTLSLLLGFTSMLGTPAVMALRSQVIPAGREMQGNSVLVTTERLTFFLGPAAVAPIMLLAGIGWVFVADALVVVAAAVSLLGLPIVVREPSHLPSETPEPVAVSAKQLQIAAAFSATRRFIVRSPTEMIGILRNDRVILALTLTAFSYVLAAGLGHMFLVNMDQSRFSGTGLFASALAAMGAGGVLGALAGGRLRFHAGWLYVLANVVEGLCWLAMPVAPTSWVVVLLAFGTGVLESVAMVVFLAEVQKRIPDAHVGRYYALLTPMTDAFLAIGIVGGTPVAAGLGLHWSGTAIFLLMAVPVLLFMPTFRGLKRDYGGRVSDTH